MTLVVKDLTCIRNHQALFYRLNFQLNPGEVLHVQGANGVGKSSLLRILCGLLEPAAGEIVWKDQLSSADPIAFNRDLGYLGHKLGLKDRLTALENIQVFESDEQNAANALESLGLTHLKHQLCENLSAGQKQRVAWARLLARKATLWLLDEPFTAIDTAGIADLESLIKGHVRQGGIVILTSHQPLQLEGLHLKSLDLHSSVSRISSD